jgi:hypothetical protein
VERRHSQLLRRQQRLTVGPAGIVKLPKDHIQIHKDMLESDMPHVTVTTTIVAFVRSMRDALLDQTPFYLRSLSFCSPSPTSSVVLTTATVTQCTVAYTMYERVLHAPAYHATHLALRNPALRPKSFNDLIEFAENIQEHKPQEQTPSSSQAMAASSRGIYAGRGSAAGSAGSCRGRARGSGRSVRPRPASYDGPWCGFHGTRFHDDKECRTQHPHLAACVVNEPANDGPHYPGPTFLDSAAFPSFLDDQREFLSPLAPSPAVALANGGQVPTQGRPSAAVRHSRGQLHISKAVHAPGIKLLLSVSQLAKNSDVLFQQDKA